MLLPFVIKTDQQSLKHLLDHKIITPFQQKWLSKLVGMDYVIEYKQGCGNKVADALSRVSNSQLMNLIVSTINSDLMEEI